MASKKYEKSTNPATELAIRWNRSKEKAHSLPEQLKAARTEQLRANVAANEQLLQLLQNSCASVNRSEKRTNWIEQAVIEQLADDGKRRASPCATLLIFQKYRSTVKS